MSEDLYWRLHALSKHMESSGRIDEHEYPSAYATILDAMNAVRAEPAPPCGQICDGVPCPTPRRGSERLCPDCNPRTAAPAPTDLTKRLHDLMQPDNPAMAKVMKVTEKAIIDALYTGEGWSRISFDTPITVRHDEVLEVDLKTGAARAVPAEPFEPLTEEEIEGPHAFAMAALTGTMSFDGVSRTVTGTDAGVNATTQPSEFDAAWAAMEARGYRYGKDALEQVRLGWDMRAVQVRQADERGDEAMRRAHAAEAALAAAAQPAEPTDAMVSAYLDANRAYWQRIDSEPGKIGKWRNGTPEEATAYSLRAALAAAAPAQPAASESVDALPASRSSIAALKLFALDVLKEWPLGDLDGGDLQEMAVKHGLLVAERRTAQCCEEGCNCAEYYSAEEWAEGITCYRRAKWLSLIQLSTKEGTSC